MQHYGLTAQSQLSIFAKGEPEGAPCYVESQEFLQFQQHAYDSLAGINWAFTAEDTRFLAHDLHPYPAKFIPQIPGTLIGQLSLRGELVFDPFGGSGTTALEAVRLGRRALSLDANPISEIIGKAKTAKVDATSLHELHALHGYLRGMQGNLPADPARLLDAHIASAPEIPNREKWFPDTSFGELALVKERILRMDSATARNIALLALSRIVLSVSFQDSETRYKSVPKDIPIGFTLSRYLREFQAVLLSVAQNESAVRYGVSRFITADIRELAQDQVAEDSVDLVVTSPPYGNATDYHLYHRFRLLWLGFDPKRLGQIEIGSHLKHQREASGFASYYQDLVASVSKIAKVLRPGRFAALVIGDSVYQGKLFETAQLLAGEAKQLGFSSHRIMHREIHQSKRSFAKAARRASSESVLVLRKRPRKSFLYVCPPPYTLWGYEAALRAEELGVAAGDGQGPVQVPAEPRNWRRVRRFSFSSCIKQDNGVEEWTWQSILENGVGRCQSRRKEPKYATHGLHPYKGKFYPQLAKGLINRTGLEEGAVVLDPYCGSGTTLLESYLNGYRSFGMDMNPLAARIANAKTSILEQSPDLVTEVTLNLLAKIKGGGFSCGAELGQFPGDTHEELLRWFPQPVLRQLNWLLAEIRASSAGTMLNYLEVVLSSIVRSVSQQEPTDLRVRYRRSPIQDADVLEVFHNALLKQHQQLEKFWAVRGYAPNSFYPATAIEADNRQWASFTQLGLAEKSVDLVLTSPPYAMALPYIDTDRLSLLAIMGMGSSQRRPLEQCLVGSREVTKLQQQAVRERLAACQLTPRAVEFLDGLQSRITQDPGAGFRKRNMPFLISRFLVDIADLLRNCLSVLKPGGQAMIIIGDSRMNVGGDDLRIPTTELVEDVAASLGFKLVDRINISVTTEGMVHQKNAITKNVVLQLQR